MKVKRLRTDCCGMKVGEIYEAVNPHGYEGPPAYVNVRLENGEWSGNHWAGISSGCVEARENPWFEVVE